MFPIIALLLVLLGLAGCTLPGTSAADASRLAYTRAHPDLEPWARHAIRQGRVVEGMTPEQVRASWGPPVSCSRAWNTTREVCLYKSVTHTYFPGRYGAMRFADIAFASVYFHNGIVEDWQWH